MISRMKFINIIAPKSAFERVVSEYVMESEIELENPMLALKNNAGFVPSTEGNPAEEMMKKFTEVFDFANVDYSKVKRHNENFSKGELVSIAESFDAEIHSLKDKMEKLEKEIHHSQEIIDTLTPVVASDVHLENLQKLEYLKFRFGRMPISAYGKLDAYLKDLPSYFVPMTSDKDFVWGVYFVTKENSENVDRVFGSLYFERFWIEGGEEGTPAEIIEKMNLRNSQYRLELDELKSRMDTTFALEKEKLLKAYADIKYEYELYNIRKYTTNSKNSFCLTGWTTEEEADALMARAEGDSECMIIADSPETVSHITPPTKLTNLKIFKPFEEFVRMYGVPNYNEMDPTPLLAVVYTLLFGIMFGDVGHGLCLALIGTLATACKKGGFLAKLLIPIGLSATLFGFVYGSFFGLEGERAIVKPIWFTPFENSTTMMSTLIYSVAIGVVLIMICMVFNIMNGVKQKNWQKILFSQNGIAGMIFYALVLYIALGAVSGNSHPLGIAVILIAISLLMIFLQEPLGRLLSRQKNWMPKEKGGFLVEAFFETFEILLSFVTNTVSFLRVGAFALNHAGMMSVVVMFMYKLSLGGSIAVTVFGNLLVIGLEGLIVGIQVLRLGFYEMFSRFYDGDGREFKPTVNNR